MRYLAGLLLLSLCICQAPRADSLPSGAETAVRAATGEIYAALERQPENAPRAVLYRLVEEILIPRADMERMSRLVLGKSWRSAQASQRERFRVEFQALLIRTYSTAIVDTSPQDIEYLAQRPSGKAGRAVVRTRIRRAGEPAVEVHYFMYLRGTDWLVYDVRIEGVSLVASYRTTFATEIRNRGIDGLIQLLEEKNRSGETMAVGGEQ